MPHSLSINIQGIQSTCSDKNEGPTQQNKRALYIPRWLQQWQMSLISPIANEI